MRREHSSILIEVLDELAAAVEASPAGVHITEVAARANLPHDRLKGYVGELVQAGLLHPQWPPAPTPKGLQFLQCYHAWIRIQGMFGLHPKPGPPQAPAVTGPAVLSMGPRARTWMSPRTPPRTSIVAAASAPHESSVPDGRNEPFVRGP